MPRNSNIKILAAAFALGAGCAMTMGKKRERFSFVGRAVLITGGSRGLGLELARQLATEGARITLVARDADELKRAEDEVGNLGTEVHSFACDVRDRDSVAAAVTFAATKMGRVDVLINNAGIIQVGPMEEMMISDFEEAMAVHFFGPLYFTLASRPHMLVNGGGRIINISSVGGKIAMPHLLPYVASKFALTGFSEGLGIELARQNIHVTTVCPGLMRTGSPRNAIFKGRHRQEYAWFSISGSLPLLSMSAARAARRIIEACRRGRPRLVLGAHAKAAVVLNEIAPGGMAKILSAINRALPANGSGTSQPKMGYESQSRWSPSWLTKLGEDAARRNNEIPPDEDIGKYKAA